MAETYSVQLVRLYLVACIVSLSSASDDSPTSTILSLSGRRVDLDSHANLTAVISWDFISSHNLTRISLSAGGDIFDMHKPRYKFYRQLKSKLSIDSVDLHHAGKYECKEFNDLKFAAELTVLEPECDTNGTGIAKEGDFLQMQCRVRYAGSLKPITTRFTWKKQGKEITPTEVFTKVYTPNETSPVIVAKSTHVVQLQADDNGITFKCDISFNTPDPSQALSYSWNYTASVHYGPRNLRIEPRNPIDQVGTKLRCFADGNPTPNYTWIATVFRKSTSEVDWTELKSELINSQGNVPYNELNFTCTAFNIVTGEKKEISGNVIVKYANQMNSNVSSANTISWTPIVCGILSLFGLVALGIGLALTWKANKNGKANRNRISENLSTEPKYEIVSESRLQPGMIPLKGIHPLYSDVAKGQDTDELRSDCYASLAESRFAEQQTAVYSQLHLRGNPK